MDLTPLPETAFIDPRGGNHLQASRLAHEVMNMVLEHLSTAEQRPPLPDLMTRLDFGDLPEEPRSEMEWLDELTKLLEASMNARTPRFIAHMNSLSNMASMLADLAAAAVDNNMLSLEMAPAFSRLERHLMQKMAVLFGLGDSAGGVLVGGGSLANLQALAVARNVKLNTLENGVSSLPNQPIIFASEVAHTSLQKAAMLLGLGTSAVWQVAANENSQMDINDLQKQIALAKDHEKIPFCVIATAGTTVTGNIDPLPDIHEIAQQNELWLHVDAAYGGALIFSKNQKHRLRGMGYADSITFNPHKWLYVARNCSMALFRDGSVLKQAFRIPVPYMSVSSDFTNIGEISVHGTNHADVLKLWLSLLYIGRTGYAHLVNECYRLADYFLQHIRKRPDLELASEPEMNLICFRAAPKSMLAQKWDEWNAEIQHHLLSQHQIFLALIPYRGAKWLRAVILNPFTEKDLIDRIFSAIDGFQKGRGAHVSE
ncbi:aspartate aminotransferase family protein [candidate division KSB1 bacterium]|nr:aspartate aminotransferase family protein [candidate division KSB1 bacterium]NIR69245.1 aspartate aminotransferase family protein [candidate division KSB1 bacterium]NIS27419.1 aspartate aminotransferase family protein [candidate division KSB1 bacterium]NIT74244.1 aspartate aminotransferase family protein [candidate division KSB1 bacterium]NIU28136.1 aspartate aminotransferase family protein [candidate division KSB1 bacterium]